jgi:cellulose biosynthesis protein BcsQ
MYYQAGDYRSQGKGDVRVIGDKHSSKIITFYSYKGGTGRSMALANVAWVLASNGRRVLAVDWDLEAPGLHRYFYPFLSDSELILSDGIIDLMIKFQRERGKLEEGVKPDHEWYMTQANLIRFTSSLAWEFPDDGTLDFIPAGRQTDSYSTRVTSFNWQSFYDNLDGGFFLEAVKERMREEYDYILIDSRTGVSDSSGICTVQMPDALAVCFTLNHQSIDGAAAVANSVYEQRREKDSLIKIFPVPMRIENGEKDKLERRREYARRQFEPFPAHVPHEKHSDYWGEVEVLYVPYYAYEEILAPFGDKGGQTISLLASAERLTAHLTLGDSGGQITRLVNPPAEKNRQRTIAAYARESLDGPLDELDESAGDEKISAAENVFASFTAEEQLIAKRVLTRLVRVSPPDEVGPNTRLRVSKADLGIDAKPILDELLYQKLVLLGADEATGEETFELAEDELAENWKRINDWLEEDRDFLLWRQTLQVYMAKWESTNKDADALLQGAFLTDAERYQASRPEALSENECTFIAESVKAEAVRDQAEEELRQKEAQARLETVKVRKEKRWLAIKYGILLFALLLLLAAAYQVFFYRERTLAFLGLGPARYVGSWSDDFQLTSDGKPESSRWDYPSEGQWIIERGEGEQANDGALVVQTDKVGVLKIAPKVLIDFSAVFKVRVVRGTKAAWMFRVQSDKQRGYLFALEEDVKNSTLMLSGYIVSKPGYLEPFDNSGPHVVPFRGCCEEGDAFQVRAEVEGDEFRFWVTAQPKTEIKGNQITTKKDRIDSGVEYFIVPFRDSRSLFPYGNVGLLVPDVGGQMSVEYIRITSDPIP